ncbi:hypothetical protein [Limnohabitans sp. TS-CS-82]|uniref:hypothetical protein n=1 Tax=Limnohabitans sp. TS-CS-82 TaxID=2094193 RepID=UPI0011B07F5F|nr:hypothetical protein [Limnohabitans sp. TS-CS-82]
MKYIKKTNFFGLMLLAAHSLSHAIDVGPLTINGFVKVETSRASNQCSDCQLVAGEARHRPWADDLAAGKSYGTKGGNVSLAQPYIGTKEFDLGQGFKVKGLLSQRWRDGKVDIPGVWYEKNATVLHEDYGSLQIGAFPTRGWSVADFPYGTKFGVADPWASSGAGYGLLTNAVRYGLPLMDVNGGDLHLELTYDQGGAGYVKHKPQFYEVYAKYVNGPLILDATAQSATNGMPMAWGHGPFKGITNDASKENLIAEGNKQSIVMLMSRYQMNAKTEVLAGVRFNRWSGNKATWLGQDAQGNDLWNDMFNISSLTGPSYSATSTDFSLGVVYKFMPKWSVNTGVVYLGKANTSNSVERGQSNSMMLNTLGVGYEIEPGFSVYGFGGMVNFGHKGLAPLSMPGHAAFTGVDSRVAKSGNWAGVGLVYTF